MIDRGRDGKNSEQRRGHKVLEQPGPARGTEAGAGLSRAGQEKARGAGLRDDIGRRTVARGGENRPVGSATRACKQRASACTQAWDYRAARERL